MAKKNENEALSWDEAYAELSEIVASLEDERISVDVLAEKMKRASVLIKLCSEKLRDTEDAVTRIIREMEDAGPTAPKDDTDEPF
jgi:exodeoxyribonuclease VII small subunit